MSGVIPDQTNDQARLNWALVAMETTWDNPHSNSAEVIMTGAGRGGFRAAVLPTKDVCRQTCKKSGKVREIIKILALCCCSILWYTVSAR